MAKTRNLNISGWIIVLWNGSRVVSCVVGYYRLSVCLVGLLRYSSLSKEETHRCFHQASLPFRGLQLSLTFLVTFGLLLGHAS